MVQGHGDQYYCNLFSDAMQSIIKLLIPAILVYCRNCNNIYCIYNDFKFKLCFENKKLKNQLTSQYTCKCIVNKPILQFPPFNCSYQYEMILISVI